MIVKMDCNDCPGGDGTCPFAFRWEQGFVEVASSIVAGSCCFTPSEKEEAARLLL